MAVVKIIQLLFFFLLRVYAFIFDVKGSMLFSREWCDLVFEGRNREYGAYVLRRDAGLRYRRVAMIFASVFFVFAVLASITGYFVYKAIQETIAEVEEVVKLKSLKDPELKNVSTGRRAVAHAKPDAVTDTPEVVEEAVVTSAPIGIKGPDDGEFVEESSMIDKDPYHNAADKELPVEGVQLTKTEMVEGMPMFPGGHQALMRFMDEHCVYSETAIKRKLEGDLEVAFIVDEEGNVIEPEVVKSLHPMLDKAALEAVKQMPKWHPGVLRGKPTCVRISIPVHFQVK